MTKRFRARRRAPCGLVTGLALGRNVLAGLAQTARGARLVITNHPNGGPVFSGPQIQPWRCQETAATSSATSRRSSPTSTSRPTPIRPASSRTTRRTRRRTWPPRPPKRARRCRSSCGEEPATRTATSTGSSRSSSPASRGAAGRPQPQWNHKLLVTHGGGCGGDYGAGSAPLDDFSGTSARTPGYIESYVAALGRGFAVMSTALDNTGHNCNLVVQAESLMMPRSGSSRTTATCATRSAPAAPAARSSSSRSPTPTRARSTTASSSRAPTRTALTRARSSPTTTCCASTSRTRRAGGPASSGRPRSGPRSRARPTRSNAIVADELFFKGATNPVGDCVPAEAVYHPETNPGGVRCSVLDYMINVLGPRPQGVWSDMEKRSAAASRRAVRQRRHPVRARRPAPGLITPAQFVDLNAKIGGFGHRRQAGARAHRRRRPRGRQRVPSGAINEGNNLDQVRDHRPRRAGPGAGARLRPHLVDARPARPRAGPPRQPRALVRPDAARRRHRAGRPRHCWRWTAGWRRSRRDTLGAARAEDRRRQARGHRRPLHGERVRAGAGDALRDTALGRRGPEATTSTSAGWGRWRAPTIRRVHRRASGPSCRRLPRRASATGRSRASASRALSPG